MRAQSDSGSHAPGLTGRRGERAVLDRFLGGVRAGESRALVVRGEPGVGKTLLLEYLAGRASECQVARAAGVQSEMELAYAGLHQLCAPMLDHAGQLPGPQRDALRVALGQVAGAPPDRFLVGLAVLGLLSEAAGERPLICVIDDVQWLDRASAQALGFAARRLAADPVGVVFGARIPEGDLAGLPELLVEGLAEKDAQVLLESVLAGPLDARVREQIIADTGGNPLALLELPRRLTAGQLAGGFGLSGAGTLDGRIEDSFGREIEALPDQTRRLLQLAAADPTGDPALLWRATRRLGIDLEASGPAVETGLAEFGARVRFRHPLVRSAAYRSAPASTRQEMHGALAEVTDSQADPDRQAWHRAQARGGLAAAAAFLDRAAALTPSVGRRAQRMLDAARATREAGGPEGALALVARAEAGPLDELQAAQAECLRGQIAYDQRRGRDAARLLLRAARLLEPLDPALARETHLEALTAAVFVGDSFMTGGVQEAAEAARTAPSNAEPPQPTDAVLDALALLLTQGHAAARTALRSALDILLELDAGTVEGRRWLFLAAGRPGVTIAMELCDWDALGILAARQAQAARDTGALVQLRSAMVFSVAADVLQGDLSAAAGLVQEERLVAEVTGTPPVSYAAMMLAAWRGREQEASELIEATVREATVREQGFSVTFADCSAAALNNGLSRYAAARDAARRAWEHHVPGLGVFAMPELAEAAARTGDVALVRAALEWVSERTRVAPTEWALGIETRVRALLHGDEVGYQQSIEHLAQTRSRMQLARSHLLYGEWLNRQNRRMNARAHLRTAYTMLSGMGAEGFAERARHELQATGDTVRKRTTGTAGELTDREAYIARLAAVGSTNAEIGAQTFLSARTVEWHLRNVYAKLEVSSRRELRRALANVG
jgi:DNA-binding CsgD family transcriptional regulator